MGRIFSTDSLLFATIRGGMRNFQYFYVSKDLCIKSLGMSAVVKKRSEAP